MARHVAKADCTVHALMQGPDEGPLMQRAALGYIQGRTQLVKLLELDRVEAEALVCVWKSILCHEASTCTTCP